MDGTGVRDSEIAAVFIRREVAEKLGRGVTRSIQSLSTGGFSVSQIDTWNTAWQQAGKGCKDLRIPLRCLAAAVDVMKSATRSDRALFRLPLEIRELRCFLFCPCADIHCTPCQVGRIGSAASGVLNTVSSSQLRPPDSTFCQKVSVIGRQTIG